LPIEWGVCRCLPHWPPQDKLADIYVYLRLPIAATMIRAGLGRTPACPNKLPLIIGQLAIITEGIL
jgi:hypothetical protein